MTKKQWLDKRHSDKARDTVAMTKTMVGPETQLFGKKHSGKARDTVVMTEKHL